MRIRGLVLLPVALAVALLLDFTIAWVRTASYCSSITVGDSEVILRERASRAGLRAGQENDRVWFSAEALVFSPLAACDVRLDHGVVVSADSYLVH